MEKFEELREKRRRGGGKRKVEVRMEVESMNGGGKYEWRKTRRGKDNEFIRSTSLDISMQCRSMW